MLWANKNKIIQFNLILFFILNFFLLLNNIAQAQTITTLFHQNADPVIGNPNGKITVVEFFDYQCPHCSDMAPVLDAIIRTNRNVRIVFKDFPVRGSLSEWAARAALAANRQGKYYAFNYALLTTEHTLTESSILDIAKNLGLNISHLRKDMYSSNITNQLNANLALGENLNLSGTPAFFIGKTNTTNITNISYVLGAMTQSELQEIINHFKE